MKGKLILTDIQSPVEGMQVVFIDTNLPYQGIHEIVEIDKEDRENITVDTKDVHTECIISELKQIVVEYVHPTQRRLVKRPPEKEYMNDIKVTLPLHPDDWKWAIEYIGEEVEFEKRMVCDQCLDDPSAHDCICNYSKYKILNLAKLIHPTPVTYTEEEAQAIARRAMFAGKTHEKIPVKFDVWWNEHKKK